MDTNYTGNQMSLFPAMVDPVYNEQMTIAERFEVFHAANPHVARLLAEMALDLRRAGRTHYGMKALVEVLRFQYNVRTVGDVFKLNNNYTAHYARLLMEQYPELEGFFETRQIRAAGEVE